MSKKKMLIFHPSLAPYRVDQFNALNEIFDLEVVFLFDNLWTFKLDQNRLRSLCTFKISYLLKGPRYKGRVFRFGMHKKIEKVNPDIIIGYEYSFTTQYLILLKRLGLIKQKLGSTIEDSLEMCVNVQSRTRAKARKHSLKYIDFIIVMSETVTDFYQEKFNFKKEEIIISPLVQSPKRLRGSSEKIEAIARDYVNKHNLTNKKVLLFVGRLIPEKGLPQFLNNISSLLLEEKNLVFIIVGDGIEMELLQSIAAEKNLHDKVIFTGKYENEELHAWYLCASGFVLPSVFEPFGAVVNEALIFGLPVLCSSYAGATSLINSENGLIFNPSNKEETLVELNSFINKIKVLENVELDSKPSLMEDLEPRFNKEWSKLN